MFNDNSSEFTKLYNTVSWRYFLTNARISGALLSILNLFFVLLVFITKEWPFIFFGLLLSLPIIGILIYYNNRLRFLKRNVHNFIYETVLFSTPIRRGKTYSFTVEALDTYGRIPKTTRRIFNRLPTHYLYFDNFVNKEVEIMHLERQKRIYVVNVKARPFYES